MAFSVAMPWSDGEHRMHELLNAPEHDNPTSSFLTPQAAYMSALFPLTAIGVLDEEHRPWTTVWGGSAGLTQPLGGNLIGTRTMVDAKYDPVVQALVARKFGKDEGEGAKGMMISGLPIDLENRRRVKLFGRVAAGAVNQLDGDKTDVGLVQLVTKVEQSLGNCPKYLNKKEIHEAVPNPQLITSSAILTAEAISLLSKADLFFLTSSNGDVDMDTNHRGGPPGFIRVISTGDDSGPASIIYPEYSGNRLYQSLGNLLTTPAAGLCVPDFVTGDVLYITGKTEILIGDDAAKLLPRTNLAVKINIIEARYVKEGLAFRGIPGESSPYNPQVRTLASEGNVSAGFEQKPQYEAALVERVDLSDTISRYRFRTDKPVSYKPGQWVALDFSPELNIGYGHMRDDDPTSLNDDFVRTFTVSSHPNSLPGNEFEITTRLHGPVTTFLRRQRVLRDPLATPVKGFGGEFRIEQAADGITPFVAGGVGVTPLIGQLPDLEVARLRLFWITRLEDVDFVLHIFSTHQGLAESTTLFLTGGSDATISKFQKKVDDLSNEGAKVLLRRPTKDDLDAVDAKRWFLCAGNPLRKRLQEWLAGKEVVYESFDY